MHRKQRSVAAFGFVLAAVAIAFAVQVLSSTRCYIYRLFNRGRRVKARGRGPLAALRESWLIKIGANVVQHRTRRCLPRLFQQST